MKRVLADLAAGLLLATAVGITVAAGLAGFLYLMVKP